MEDIKATSVFVSSIFEEPPKQWGLRGDPYLWEEMKNEFSTVPVNISIEDFEKRFKEIFVDAYAFVGSVEGQYSASVGYDRQEQYLREKTEMSKGVSYTKLVPDTRTVTDWQPFSSYYQNLKNTLLKVKRY